MQEYRDKAMLQVLRNRKCNSQRLLTAEDLLAAYSRWLDQPYYITVVAA